MHCEVPLKPGDPEQPWRYCPAAGLQATDNKRFQQDSCQAVYKEACFWIHVPHVRHWSGNVINEPAIA